MRVFFKAKPRPAGGEISRYPTAERPALVTCRIVRLLLRRGTSKSMKSLKYGRVAASSCSIAEAIVGSKMWLASIALTPVSERGCTAMVGTTAMPKPAST